MHAQRLKLRSVLRNSTGRLGDLALLLVNKHKCFTTLDRSLHRGHHRWLDDSSSELLQPLHGLLWTQWLLTGAMRCEGIVDFCYTNNARSQRNPVAI